MWLPTYRLSQVDAILGYSGNIEFCAPTERESTLQAVVEKKRALFGNDSVVVIPPFNDPLVMAGQGTLAIEILRVFTKTFTYYYVIILILN